jgi:hypothetical protein
MRSREGILRCRSSPNPKGPRSAALRSPSLTSLSVNLKPRPHPSRSQAFSEKPGFWPAPPRPSVPRPPLRNTLPKPTTSHSNPPTGRSVHSPIPLNPFSSVPLQGQDKSCPHDLSYPRLVVPTTCRTHPPSSCPPNAASAIPSSWAVLCPIHPSRHQFNQSSNSNVRFRAKPAIY